MCKYCHIDNSGLPDEEIMKNQKIDLGIVDCIYLNSCIQDENVLSTYLMDSYSNLLAEYNVKIKYCPMCGRKLVEDV